MHFCVVGMCKLVELGGILWNKYEEFVLIECVMLGIDGCSCELEIVAFHCDVSELN